MPPRTQPQELPDVDTTSLISAELRSFRFRWEPKNPMFGDPKWNQVLEFANRIDKGIDEVRIIGNPFEVTDAIRAAREELQLALTQNMPKKVREELSLYLEMYSQDT
jgi:hypothetical protein